MKNRGLKSKTWSAMWYVLKKSFNKEVRRKQRLFSCEQVASLRLSQQIPGAGTERGLGKSPAKDRFYSADVSGPQREFPQSCLSWRSFISQTSGLFIVCLGDSSRVRILTSPAKRLGCRAEPLGQEGAPEMLAVRLTREQSRSVLPA